ncbi:MAG: T9SS type A sorting domain-containing protein [Flavobacteriales bacterium]
MLRSSLLSLSALAVMALVSTAQAQAPVDIGLRSTGENLEVVLRPGNDFSGILSSVVFTIRWERSSGAALGDVEQEGVSANYIPVQPSGAVREVGGYDYQVFAGFGTRPLHTLSTAWSASKEYVIATIPVTGDADFELVNDGWTAEATNNADFYMSLGGVDRTGIIYKGLATANGDGDVSILPNPNKGIFTFAVEVENAVDLTVEVVNTLGQSIFTDEVTKFSGTYRRDMDITSMSSGVYILKVGRGEVVTSHKIIYNK